MKDGGTPGEEETYLGRAAGICTKLAEAGVPESTMLDMMGHVSTAMLRRYSHIFGRKLAGMLSMRSNRASSQRQSPKFPPR